MHSCHSPSWCDPVWCHPERGTGRGANGIVLHAYFQETSELNWEIATGKSCTGPFYILRVDVSLKWQFFPVPFQCISWKQRHAGQIYLVVPASNSRLSLLWSETAPHASIFRSPVVAKLVRATPKVVWLLVSCNAGSCSFSLQLLLSSAPACLLKTGLWDSFNLRWQWKAANTLASLAGSCSCLGSEPLLSVWVRLWA